MLFRSFDARHPYHATPTFLVGPAPAAAGVAVEEKREGCCLAVLVRGNRSVGEKAREEETAVWCAGREWSAAVASPERTCGCVRTPPDDSITAAAAGPTSYCAARGG